MNRSRDDFATDEHYNWYIERMRLAAEWKRTGLRPIADRNVSSAPFRPIFPISPHPSEFEKPAGVFKSQDQPNRAIPVPPLREAHVDRKTIVNVFEKDPFPDLAREKTYNLAPIGGSAMYHAWPSTSRVQRDSNVKDTIAKMYDGFEGSGRDFLEFLTAKYGQPRPTATKTLNNSMARAWLFFNGPNNRQFTVESIPAINDPAVNGLEAYLAWPLQTYKIFLGRENVISQQDQVPSTREQRLETGQKVQSQE